MSESIQDKAALFATLPAPWPQPLLPAIREALAARPERLVVLDDDPTGTQTVHGVPVLTQWPVAALAEELARSPVFYLLTNSRSLATPQARTLAREVGANLRAAAQQAGRPVVVASRSDSTLRGHYPAEVDALGEALGGGFAGTILAMFFEEGGRFTVGDVHYVQQGTNLVPAAQTEFAQDRSFGYRHSDLRAYVEEKTGGRVRAADVVRVTLDDLRRGGADAVAARLAQVPTGGVAVVNSAAYRDQEVFVAGLLQAEAAGRRFLYRCAASFVRVRAGLDARPLLSGAEMRGPGTGGGLVVVGSHVAKSSEQLRHLLAAPGVHGVELRVPALLDAASRDAEVAAALRAVATQMAAGQDAVLYTSRDLHTGADTAANLAIGATVSEALCSVVRRLQRPPRFLIAKGGITSSDVATRGLGVRRALVLGQIQPGVPVWRLGDEARFPGMAYVVYPGNVGAPDGIAQAVALLRGG